jgi:creatinine amidohydrolase/Fe(II)-dependent formamide hydrolase-like protein
VRLVEAWGVKLTDLLERQQGPLHAGEAETSVMLHLYPELVRMDRARDHDVSHLEFKKYLHGGLPTPPGSGSGAVGFPTLATAEKGARIYERILDAVRRAVFLAPEDIESDTI